MDTERRSGGLQYEPDAGVLVVGARTATLEREAPVEAVVSTYVDLLFAQREVKPSSHLDLRNRELVQLSELLVLPPEELDALIDRELERLLGQAPSPAPAPTDAPVPAAVEFASLYIPTGVARARWRNRLAIALAVVAVALSGGSAVAVALQGDEPAPAPDPAADAGGTSEQIDLPGGGTATRTESPAAPVSEDGADVGTALQISRNP